MLYSSLEIHLTRSNLRPVPIFVSLLFGVIVSLYAIGVSISILGELFDGYDSRCGNYGPDGCSPGVLAIKILAIVTALAALLLG